MFFPFGSNLASGFAPIVGTPFYLAWGHVTADASGVVETPVLYASSFPTGTLELLTTVKGVTPYAVSAPYDTPTRFGANILAAGGPPLSTVVISYLAIGY